MKDLIFDQNDIPKDKWRYGLRPSAATGCGWIATHNALCLMGHDSEPEELIRWYERSLPIINGNFGTFIFSIKAFFALRGFRTVMTAKASKLDAAVKNCDAAILFYRWKKKMKFGSHYVTVQYKNGRYVGLNAFTGSKDFEDYGLSLESFLKKRGYFGPILLAITDRGGRK